MQVVASHVSKSPISRKSSDSNVKKLNYLKSIKSRIDCWNGQQKMINSIKNSGMDQENSIRKLNESKALITNEISGFFEKLESSYLVSMSKQ